MRTLFLNPPAYENFDGGAGSRYQATREVWSFWYPTWLCYPAGMIKDSRVLDAPPEKLNQVQTVAIAKEYDFVVLHTSTPSFKMDVRTAEMIKAENSNCVIAFVGGHATAMPEQTLKASPAVDIAARKEFDFSMKEVAEGWDWAKIQGISYQKDGKIHHNLDRAPLLSEDLDKLPFVTQIYDRDLDFRKYNSPYCQYPYVSLYTGRGCPARCTFCLWPQVTTGHSYRTRSVDNVIEEVKEMKRLFPGMKEIFFDDDTFTADRKRAQEIAQKLKPLGLCWSTNSRANVDYETLKIMKDGGLRLFVIGYESGNADILKNIKKGVALETARRFTQDCHKLGILIHGTFILGLPGETRETIQETMRFAKEMNPETIQVSLASPYPGTAFYDYAIEHGYIKPEDMVDETGYQRCVINYPGLSGDEIYQAVEKFYKSYYLRPRYIFKSLKKMALHADERKRMWQEGKDFFRTMRKRREVIAAKPQVASSSAA
ncbi:MAG: hopanoid biosynthesis associated radical SAM protein HpnJ [Deltaproteobacteria bacterium]|nr:hopanoid biosynthesis associated radical SAM protein HpnJ [Deltaproteobacteria bacterium]